MERVARSPPIPEVQVELLDDDEKEHGGRKDPRPSVDATPRIWGIPLKYLSLITLAVQNASLTIIMHYSRISTSPSQTYSAASAVLLNELLKGSISLVIAYSRIKDSLDLKQTPTPGSPRHRRGTLSQHTLSLLSSTSHLRRLHALCMEIFSPDCWKLSIPAILYVIQNNLQFVAASNLEPSTFQVSYQMKILTTAAFSVLLLRKQIGARKWFALVALALGVGIVQIQSGGKTHHSDGKEAHVMHPLTGFMAVVAACFTSGLAGVYFEMVLKNSQADLWVRNVQLSLFSLVPAVLPVLASQSRDPNVGWLSGIFANFGGWAWATVLVQVFGGLVTAIVIKYSDNIMKSFATSLSIVISFLASVVLFDLPITPNFILGSSTVLTATFVYNKPETKVAGESSKSTLSSKIQTIPKLVTGVMSPKRSLFADSPVDSDGPILGEEDRKHTASPRMLANALKLITPRTSLDNLAGHNDTLNEVVAPILSRTGSSMGPGAYTGYSSPYYSRSHSPAPGAMGTPPPPPPGVGLFYTGSSSSSISRAHSSSQLLVPHAPLPQRLSGQYFPNVSSEISLDEPLSSSSR